MPYTPPAHTPASPIKANHYFDTYHHGHRQLPHSPASSTCPSLPRSRSSSSASRRRQEEEEEVMKNTAANTQREEGAKIEQALSIDTSVRQSPPPVTDAVMPAGAVMSPPDSGHNSSDEEGASKHKTEDAEGIKQLEKAVRESLHINREGSPDMDNAFQYPPRSDGEDGPPTSPSKLSHTAKKIVHSRSSTDSAIVFTPPPQSAESSANASGEDGSDDDGNKPALIRKKSGELVKPAIRPKNRRTASSMPGTPTYGKKGVHFNDDIQQVRHFLQVDRPIAVSAGGSPVEALEEDREFPFGKPPPSPSSSGLDVRLRNFPRNTFERQSQLVKLDRLTLSADQKSLVGYVVVANIAFHKSVVARFTFDSWRTTSEVLAEFNNSPIERPRDGYDPFTFAIKLSDQTNIERKTMFVCIRYSVNGHDYWDNNNSSNFHVDFTKKQSTASSAPGLGTRPIPRSKRNSLAPRPRSMPSFDEDFAGNFDIGPELKLKQPSRTQGNDVPQPRRLNPSSQQFGTRYDFGASLTAALNHAQTTLGDRSGLKSKETASSSGVAGSSQEAPGSSIARLQRHTPPQTNSSENPRTEALNANNSSLNSRAYQEFVSKFCFFGSGKPQTNNTASEQSSTKPHGSAPSTGHDGAHDERPPVPTRSPEHSLNQHEASSRQPHLSNEHNGSVLSPQLLGRAGGPRSPSPDYQSPVGYGSRSSSPASLSYRFGQNSGFLSSGATTPATAIQG